MNWKFKKTVKLKMGCNAAGPYQAGKNEVTFLLLIPETYLIPL